MTTEPALQSGKTPLREASRISISSETRRPAESVKQWVYRSLRKSIMSGHFRPGLPITIAGIAESLEVSATPVRGALDQLIADGALQYMDNRRVRVPDIDPEKFDEIVATRIALETLAAARAMHFIDYLRLDHLQFLDGEIDLAYESGDIELGIERNFAFHRCIYEVRPSFVLLPLIESVWLRLGPFMHEATAQLEESYRIDRHGEAIAAIRAKDVEALKAAITADIEDGTGHLGRTRFLTAASKSRET